MYAYAANNPVRYTDPDGRTTEDGEEVTVIFYYKNFDQSKFKEAAKTASSSYSNEKNTYMIGVYTADDFKSQWNLLNAYFDSNNIEVDNMEIFCHGNEYNLYFKGSDFHASEVELLDDFSFSDNATMILHSCNSGGAESGIAQAFATKENINVEAQNGYANFSSKFESFKFSFSSSHVYLEAYDRTNNNKKGNGKRLDRKYFSGK